MTDREGLATLRVFNIEATSSLFGFSQGMLKPIYEGAPLFSAVHAFLDARGLRLLEVEPACRSQDGEILQVDALFMRTS